MISSILFFIVCMVFFRYPLAGLFTILAFLTGGSNIAAKIFAHAQFWVFNSYEAAFVVSTVSLLRRPSRIRLDAIGVTVWMMTLCGVLSIILYTNDLTRNILKLIMDKLAMWGMLYTALTRLTDSERTWVRYGLMIAASMTGLLLVVGILTGSPLILKQLSSLQGNNAITGSQIAGLSVQAYMLRRITLPGVWTLMPMGIWPCFWGAVLWWKTEYSLRSWACLGGIFFILYAIALNLTRNLVAGIAGGLMVMWALAWICRKEPLLAFQKFMIRGAVLGGVVIIVWQPFFDRIAALWDERLFGSQRSVSLLARLNQNQFMMDDMLRHFSLLGMAEPVKLIGGDPHQLIMAWWTYGLLFALCLLVLHILGIVGLLKVVLGRTPQSRSNLLLALVWIGFWVNMQMGAASGDYLFDSTWFMLMYFLSEVSLLSAGAADVAGYQIKEAVLPDFQADFATLHQSRSRPAA